jgi:hypothetical protein
MRYRTLGAKIENVLLVQLVGLVLLIGLARLKIRELETVGALFGTGYS